MQGKSAFAALKTTDMPSGWLRAASDDPQGIEPQYFTLGHPASCDLGECYQTTFAGVSAPKSNIDL
jgi:hypothetical protein